MKRCVFVINQDWYFCSHWMVRAIAIKKSGFEVWVAVPPGDQVIQIEQAGLRVLPIKIQRKDTNPLKELLSFLDLLVKLYKLSPELIINSTIKPSLYGSLIGRLLRIPTISSINGLGHIFINQSWKSKSLRRIIQVCFRLAATTNKNRFLFQNQEDKDLFIGNNICRKQQTNVIPGAGVDPDKYAYSLEPESATVKILFAARLLWEKGIKELIQAANILKENNTNCEIFIAGILDEGNPSAVSEDNLIEWERHKLIRWLGKIEHMSELISSVNIVTLPTFYGEGIPKILIEAAACGRPIVTTNTPGCRDIVTHEKNGLLVPTKNPHLLAKALERLIYEPETRIKMGKFGRQLVLQNYSEEIIVRKTINMVNELLYSE